MILNIPLKTIALGLFSLTWLGISVRQWVFDFPNTSNLLFAIGFFFVGLYVAYDQWFKQTMENKINDIGKDIQMIDKKVNELEIKLIEKLK